MLKNRVHFGQKHVNYGQKTIEFSKCMDFFQFVENAQLWIFFKCGQNTFMYSLPSEELTALPTTSFIQYACY